MATEHINIQLILLLTVGFASASLFNLRAIFENFSLFIGTLAIILIAKPVTAYVIAKGFGRTTNEALTVANAI